MHSIYQKTKLSPIAIKRKILRQISIFEGKCIPRTARNIYSLSPYHLILVIRASIAIHNHIFPRRVTLIWRQKTIIFTMTIYGIINTITTSKHSIIRLINIISEKTSISCLKITISNQVLLCKQCRARYQRKQKQSADNQRITKNSSHFSLFCTLHKRAKVQKTYQICKKNFIYSFFPSKTASFNVSYS